jgi:hypothetical protein
MHDTNEPIADEHSAGVEILPAARAG